MRKDFLTPRGLRFSCSLLLFSTTILFQDPLQAIEFKNISTLEETLNTLEWKRLPSQERVKIAILDKSFFGLDKEIGHSLPSDTQYFRGIVKSPENLDSPHGTVMAQIVSKIADNPQLYLFNCFGYSNLEFAVNQLIQLKVDIVLYSEVWEFGGNHDGGGFINALVDKALDEGIFWVNAAGNFETLSYTGPIVTKDEDWVQLPDQNRALKIVCKHPIKSECPFKAVLSWNSFEDDVKMGTDKDLDFALSDDLMNIIESSGQKQSPDNIKGQAGLTNYPRETISKTLKNGVYYLQVKNRSKNFESKDRLYITVDGEGLSMPSHTIGESLMNPADNPRVLTVGASDSERSSVSLKLHKPDILSPSSIKTEDGEFRGSSNSAALVAGSLALVKSRKPEMDFDDILRESKLDSLSGSQETAGRRGQGISLNWLGFYPMNGRCFEVVPMGSLPPHLASIVQQKGVFVKTTLGLRLMTPFDPIQLSPRLHRVMGNDMVLATPQGIQLAPRNVPNLPSNWVEVFQQPPEFSICQRVSPPGTHSKNIFRLKNP